MNQATATDLAFQEDTTPINESFQADVERFTTCIADCVRSTDSFLTDPINRGKAGKFRISRITAGLFLVIVSLTLVLNISMLSAGATIVQLLICNAGLVILNLLASICIASDLARGKTHFLSERAHLARQFHQLSDHMTDLLGERNKWIDALNRCKWGMDAERLKAQLAAQELQLAAQELQSTEEKLVAVKMLLRDKQAELSSMEAQRATAARECQKSMEDRNAATAEVSQLKLDCENLTQQISSAKASLEATDAACAAKVSELEQINLECQKIADQKSACEAELNQLQIEVKDAHTFLAAQQSEQVDLLTQLKRENDQLNQERAALELEVQETQQIKSELQAEINESRTTFASFRLEREHVLAQLTSEIAAAESKLQTQQREVDESTATAEALTATITQLDAKVIQTREVLLELNTKAEFAQHCNVQLINEAINLEVQTAQHRESFARAEAELEGIRQQLDENKSVLDKLRTDELKIELRIANLLTQADKLECLAVATSTSLSDVQAQQQVIAATTVAELQEQKARLDQELKDLRAQIETETITSKQLADNASEAQNTAKKTVADAERRVEMLTEKSESLAAQVQTRSAELYAFKQELIELRVEVRDLEATKLELREVDQELEALKLHLVNQRCQIAMATGQIAEHEEQIKTRQTVARELELQITELDSQFQSALTNHTALNQSLEQIKLERNAVTAENQLLVEEKLELEVAINHVLESKRQATQELRELVEQVNNQVAQIGQLERERSATESDVADLTATVQFLFDQRSQLECEVSKLPELLARRAELEDEVASLNTDIETLTQRQAAAIDQAETSQMSVLEIESKIGTLRDQVDELELKQAEFVAANESAQLELSHTLQQQQTAKDDYKASVLQTQTLEAQICAAQAQLESLSNQHITASAELQRVIDDVNDAQSVAKQWTTYLESLNLEVESQRKTHSEIQNSVDALRAIESQATLSMQTAAHEIELLLERQANLLTSNKHQELVLERNQHAVDEATGQLTDLQYQLSDTTEKIAELERQVAGANQELHAVEAAINTAMQSRDAIEKQIIERQAQIEQVSAKHTSLLENVHSLVEEQAHLEATLEELNRRLAASEADASRLEANKQRLEVDLHQQQIARELVAEQKAAIESEIGLLNAEVATLQLAKLELSRVEACCAERTDTLNAICEETTIEQTRLGDLRKQIVVAQALLETAKEQQASVETMRSALEQQNEALRQSLSHSEKELIASLESQQKLAKQMEAMDLELKQIVADRSSMEDRLQQVSECLIRKSTDLQQTEDDLAAAESKAHELWATISEMQKLHTDLDHMIVLKRDEVGSAQAETLKQDQIRLSLLAQNDSIQSDLATSTLQLQETQNLKLQLETDVSQLNAQVEQLQIEITNANAHLEQLSEKISTASMIQTSLELPEALETNAQIPDLEIEVAGVLEHNVISSQSETDIEIQDSRLPEVASPTQEADIWTSLGELARISDVVRVDAVREEQVRKLPHTPPLVKADAAASSTKASFDEWEAVFAPTSAQQRAR